MAKYVTETNVASYLQVDQGREKTFESQLLRSNLFLDAVKNRISEQKDYFTSMRQTADPASYQYLTGVIDGLTNTLNSVEELKNILYPSS